MPIKNINKKLYVDFKNKSYLLNCFTYGGNSKIYKFTDDIGDDYVVKVFHCSKRGQVTKRYERFKSEVKIIDIELKGLKGIVPCIDKYLPKSPTKGMSYYIMPKCDSFDVLEEKDITQKLKDILSIAYILKEVHKKNIAHRDIKPQNILIYDGKICLSDFGIAKEHDNPNRLTTMGEKVGPSIILPPELRKIDTMEKELNYYKSDVYLLAKVLWMYLKRDTYGFYGEYSRSTSVYYNAFESDKIKCSEPLQLLFEKSTYDEIEKRISLDEFIFLLKEQISILENTMNEKQFQKYSNEEVTQYYIKNIRADKLIYDNNEKIEKFLKSITDSTYIKIIDVSCMYQETFKNYYISLSGDAFCLKVIVFNKNISLYFNVKKLEYDLSDKITTIVIENEDILVAGKKAYDKEEIFFENDFFLPDIFMVKFIPNYLEV